MKNHLCGKSDIHIEAPFW